MYYLHLVRKPCISSGTLKILYIFYLQHLQVWSHWPPNNAALKTRKFRYFTSLHPQVLENLKQEEWEHWLLFKDFIGKPSLTLESFYILMSPHSPWEPPRWALSPVPVARLKSRGGYFCCQGSESLKIPVEIRVQSHSSYKCFTKVCLVYLHILTLVNYLLASVLFFRSFLFLCF